MGEGDRLFKGSVQVERVCGDKEPWKHRAEGHWRLKSLEDDSGGDVLVREANGSGGLWSSLD